MLRRGFKTEANAIAREVRVQLGRCPWDAVDPVELAERRGMRILPLSAFADAYSAQVTRLRDVDPRAFSAMTVHHGPNKLIVFNDGHSKSRQNANISHEVAHEVLQHPPRPVFDVRGCRDFDRSSEDEADWLGPAILVSEEAALLVAREGIPLDEAAERYGVSEQVMRFRLNVTAAYRRVA